MAQNCDFFILLVHIKSESVISLHLIYSVNNDYFEGPQKKLN